MDFIFQSCILYEKFSLANFRKMGKMACLVGGMSYLENVRKIFFCSKGRLQKKITVNQFETQGDPPAKVEVDLADAGNGVGADLVG